MPDPFRNTSSGVKGIMLHREKTVMRTVSMGDLRRKTERRTERMHIFHIQVVSGHSVRH